MCANGDAPEAQGQSPGRKPGQGAEDFARLKARLRLLKPWLASLALLRACLSEKRCPLCAAPAISATGSGPLGIQPPALPLAPELLPAPALPLTGQELALQSGQNQGLHPFFGFSGLCLNCQSRLPRRVRGYCPRCGEPSAWPDLDPALCPSCLAVSPLWERAFFYGIYEDALRGVILNLKYSGGLHLAGPLARLLASVPDLAAWASERQGTQPGQTVFIVPVPLSLQRQHKRGFNQALELGRHLSALLGLPLRSDLLRRIKHRPPQNELTRSERLLNMHGVFSATPAALGKHILLLDDVMTTGATFSEAARVLLGQGAASVVVAAVGRASLL